MTGVVLLERRVIALKDDRPDHGDLVVKVTVDGWARCFCKAKHDSAREAGVHEDRRGGTYYIDAVPPTAVSANTDR